ncbi:hypothetical protein E2C01_005278 [Portunus trituberculatus]|uniref:Uncharacterized protein n=1 Tax=Portunus trituberculatus TaxID=210409 RepID=A0A5B7CS44_PORTR|nr:hypothetical protein [Portunus trituberculatus]
MIWYAAVSLDDIALPTSAIPASVHTLRKTSKRREKTMPPSTQTTGVSVNIRRTITPAKYTALTANNTTVEGKYHRPTGKVGTRMWRSKKKLNQVVG